jgi:PAS domain S-box-containing protein
LSQDAVPNIEFLARIKNGKIRIALGWAALIEIKGETCLVSLAADITDARHDEIIASPVMIWISDPDGLITWLNRAWLEFTGRTLAQEAGNGWIENVRPEDLRSYMNISRDAFTRRASYQAEFRLRRYDGDVRRILVSALPRFNPDHSFAGYVGAAIDITEKRQAEAVLSQATQKLIRDQEHERTSLAKELLTHTEQLTMLSLNMDRFDEPLSPSVAELKQKIERAKQQVEDLIFEIQALSHRLHSSKLEYLGLEATAAAYCDEFSEQKGPKIDFSSHGVPEKVSQDISLCLLRVLQEVLQSASTDNSTMGLHVSLEGTEHELGLTVTTAVADFGPEHAICVALLKERLKIVHGEFSIKAQSGGGMVIRAQVPLRNSLSAHHS